MKTTKPTCSSGLSADTYNIITPGVYTIYTRATDLPPSGLVVTISQSGSVNRSVVTPTTSEKQIDIESNATFNCAANDVLSVVLSSSAAADQPPNLIKTIINLRQGL